MALFQKNILKRELEAFKEANKKALDQAWQNFQQRFLDAKKQENIRASKEEQYQEGFLRELFCECLGYTIAPDPNYNLITEQKNEKGQKKADGAIILKENVSAVIELKGTDTSDLNKIEAQAFGYKNNHKNCSYVIISNFEKLRFYIDNTLEPLEFHLFSLSEEDFALLYFCLSLESISKDRAKKTKKLSVSQEDVITKQLYKDYSLFKRELFANICTLNPQFDKLLLFKKSQKLLDRLLFIFFAEDKFLLPPNSIRKILKQWNQLKELDAYTPLYERFKKYFGYMNTGFKGKEYEVFAYNGGLFKPDEVLDNIVIDDDILYQYTKQLSEYDFESEVDVNILGHIFENSLSEIEEVQELINNEELKFPSDGGVDCEQSEQDGVVFDEENTTPRLTAYPSKEGNLPKTSKRKKDGVFYTPKYITKYIVENTIGKLCEAKKTELEIQEEDYTSEKRRQKKTTDRLLQKLKDYREWLLELTICDPACGSGAFLNEALNFLIAEHRLLDELETKLLGGGLVFSNIECSILENNLFGVDINEESVEIAKLSLWLRTAQPNRKLNNLNNNIKCGNSLIDDPKFDKAFKWEDEFPQVFAKGGFDIIIGNPPYVKLEYIKATSEILGQVGYQTFSKRGDLYVLFVERAFQLIKDEGLCSFIMPNKWLQADYGKVLRQYFLQENISKLIDFGDLQVFEGATTYPCIFISQKAKLNDELLCSVLTKDLQEDFEHNISANEQVIKCSKLREQTWVLVSKAETTLLDRINRKFKPLKDIVDEAKRGLITGYNKAYTIDNAKRLFLEQEDSNSSHLIGKLLRGRDLYAYSPPIYDNLDNMILAFYGSFKVLESDYPAIYKHLLQHKEALQNRGQCKGSKATENKPFIGQHHWLELDNTPSLEYLNLYKKNKIMYQKFQVRPCFIYDDTGLYCNDSMWIIPTEDKGLLALLNSKMSWWLISKYCTQIQNGYQLIWKYFGQIPIPQTTDELSELAVKMMNLHKDLQVLVQRGQNFLMREFAVDKLSKKLEAWHELSVEDFLKELKKLKKKLSLCDKADWEEYFLVQQEKVQPLLKAIEETDKAINTMVYELYGLTEEEIKLVEAS